MKKILVEKTCNLYCNYNYLNVILITFSILRYLSYCIRNIWLAIYNTNMANSLKSKWIVAEMTPKLIYCFRLNYDCRIHKKTIKQNFHCELFGRLEINIIEDSKNQKFVSLKTWKELWLIFLHQFRKDDTLHTPIVLPALY